MKKPMNFLMLNKKVNNFKPVQSTFKSSIKPSIVSNVFSSFWWFSLSFKIIQVESTNDHYEQQTKVDIHLVIKDDTR